jgi:aminopeptidase N
MIEGHIGAEHYRQGVRTYLNQHQYACAQSRDLWEAFEQASDQPITAMMQSWINQPGHPVLHVRRDADSLHLRQQRFTYLKNKYQQIWLVPITLTVWDAQGRPRNQALLLDTTEATIPIAKDTAAYKLNTGQTGFYRVAYQDRDNLAALGAMIADQKIPAVDRWGLQNDMYALVRQTSLPLSDYLDFLEHYTNERDYLPLTSIAEHLQQAMLAAPLNRRATIAATGRKLAEAVLDQIGYAPARQETQTTSLLRDQLLWLAVLWGSDMAKAFGEEQFNRMMRGEKLHPDIARSALQSGAFCDGEKAFVRLCDCLAQSTSEHERMNILIALSAFQQWDLMEKALAYTLEKVPPRNRFIPIVAAAANPANQDHLWEWFQKNLTRLEELHPLLFERTITGVWPFSGLSFLDDVKRFGLAYIKDRPALTDAVKLALENLEINGRMREHMASDG